MIKVMAGDTSAMSLAGSRQDQVSRGPGVWRVTGRHARLSVVAAVNAVARRRSRPRQFVELTNAPEPQCRALLCGAEVGKNGGGMAALIGQRVRLGSM